MEDLWNLLTPYQRYELLGVGPKDAVLAYRELKEEVKISLESKEVGQ